MVHVSTPKQIEKVKGSLKEALGKLTGDPTMQENGAAQKQAAEAMPEMPPPEDPNGKADAE